MLVAHGWAVLQASRECYLGAGIERLLALDEVSEAEDARLWADFRTWMEKNSDPFMIWTLTDHLNNHSGLLQFTLSRNRRPESLWRMLRWLATSSVGTYGIVYVHDDEDMPGSRPSGRRDGDHSNEYRVWRILKGNLVELDDPFLSPIVPTIRPSFGA